MMISHGTLICEISFNGRMVKFNNLIDRKLLNSTNQFHRDIVSLRFNHEGKTIFLTLLKKNETVLIDSLTEFSSTELSSTLESSSSQQSTMKEEEKEKMQSIIVSAGYGYVQVFQYFKSLACACCAGKAEGRDERPRIRRAQKKTFSLDAEL